MDQSITFCIVHFNTPILTESLCKSILKNHESAKIILFDNSDRLPFKRKFYLYKYFDNTCGNIINFDNELLKYKDRDIKNQVACGANFGSVKHTMSINWLLDNINSNFILLDSDVLLKKKIDFIDNNYLVISDIYKNLYGGSKLRCSPMLCFFNIDLYRKYKLSFFDENRIVGLNVKNESSSLYDTGSSFYEDIQCIKNGIKQINMLDYIEHYGNGSWNLKLRSGIRHTNLNYKDWLDENRFLFEPFNMPIKTYIRNILNF